MQSQMNGWVKAACEPAHSLSVALGFNSLGWILYADSKGRQVADASHIQGIVKEIVGGSEQVRKYAWDVGDPFMLTALAAASTEIMDPAFSCYDNNTLTVGANIGDRLWALSGNESFRGVKSCAEARDYCFADPTGSLALIGQNVRFLCAHTCGCSDPMAGLWDLGKARLGCPATHCQRRMANNMRKSSVQCVDMNQTYLMSHGGWRHLLHRLNKTRTVPQDAVQNMSILGCEAIRYFNAPRTRDVCSLGEVINDIGVAPFCPESCRCASATQIRAESDCPGLCPKTCCYGYDYTRF